MKDLENKMTEWKISDEEKNSTSETSSESDIIIQRKRRTNRKLSTSSSDTTDSDKSLLRRQMVKEKPKLQWSAQDSAKFFRYVIEHPDYKFGGFKCWKHYQESIGRYHRTNRALSRHFSNYSNNKEKLKSFGLSEDEIRLISSIKKKENAKRPLPRKRW